MMAFKNKKQHFSYSERHNRCVTVKQSFITTVTAYKHPVYVVTVSLMMLDGGDAVYLKSVIKKIKPDKKTALTYPCCVLDQRNPEARKQSLAFTIILNTEITALSSTAAVSTKQVGVKGDVVCFTRSTGREDSVCERTQDEEAILFFSDPLQQFVDSRDSQGLGPQWTEAEVELEATCHPCQQVFSFTAAVEGAEGSSWMMQAAMKILVQPHQSLLLFIRLVQ